MKRNVVFGLFDPEWDGVTPDATTPAWRPTLCAVTQPDFPVARFILLVQSPFLAMAEKLVEEMRAASPGIEIEMHTNTLNDPWDFEEVYGYLFDIAEGQTYDLDHEDYFVHMSAGTHVMRISLFLLIEARILPGRLLQSYPAGLYGAPGVRMVDLDLANYDQLARRFESRKSQSENFLKGGIATLSPAFNRMIGEIEQVAIRSTHPILLTGPTGAGKTQLAQRIFDLKKMRHQVKGEFVSANCATLRGDNAMSALFGHRKGAYTGATTDREGLLKRADGGLLFLDEIGELGIEEQAMLLTALEKGAFYPLGADRQTVSRFQLIAGTNQDLARRIREGRFRADLLARINLWQFHLPGLRDRAEDNEPNLDFELAKFAAKEGRQVSFNRAARMQYLDFALSPEAHWTGNFRDLNASVTRMATLAAGGRIDSADVMTEIVRLHQAWQIDDAETSRLEAILPPDAIARIDRFDRMQIEAVLAVCAECRTLAEAGRRLFDQSRTRKETRNDSDRLRKYLARFDVNPQDVLAG